MRLALLVILTLLALAGPRPAAAWWDGDWPYRKKITLEIGADGIPVSAPLRQVPVLVRLHAGNFGFVDAQESGADLRIVSADDKTLLPFQIERFDWVDELAYIWVQVPALGTPDAPPYIWIYYGNAGAKAPAATAPVWDQSQTLVWHFAERQPLPQDASGLGNNALRSDAAPVAAGQIDAAMHYDGTTATTVAPSASLKLGPKGGFTFSAWIKEEGTQSATLLQEQDGRRSLTIALDGDQPVVRLVGDDGRIVATPAKARLAPDAWHHLAVTVADKAVVYVDGAAVADIPATLPELAGEIRIGSGFKGFLDEVRLASQARPPERIAFEALAERPDSRLLAFGEDEQASSGSDYLATIGLLVNSVSLDGWVVIALIGLLGFVSAEVAIAKAQMLGRVVKANGRFLDGFRGQGAAALAPGAAQAAGTAAWRDSPLFAMYRAGAVELDKVVEALGEGRPFNAFSLEVVRAAVDTSLVNEVNRINQRMVLLTLAISGAPFLGLLGTVVGIMITFATIALKGDVNINTIAPGIAAAITATAAGMLVAIPALFAYNVLATRIREVTTVMDTFRDEFLSKVAAKYS